MRAAPSMIVRRDLEARRALRAVVALVFLAASTAAVAGVIGGFVWGVSHDVAAARRVCLAQIAEYLDASEALKCRYDRKSGGFGCPDPREEIVKAWETDEARETWLKISRNAR